MFWKYNINSPSQIDSLLSKEDVTLQEVMDAEDVINECKAQNKILIDFLQKPEVMEELVTLITREPSIELEEWNRFKYPNLACELLTCDVPALNERLASDEALLDKLYTFLESELPLNPLLASYFSKVMGVLIARKTEQNWLSYQFTCLQVLDFLKTKDTFIPLLLKHLSTSAIMDLMLKLMTQVEGVETRQNILNWLDSQRIMQALVALLHPSIDKEKHFNVAQLLCDFIRTARDTQRSSTERVDPDPLLNTLESSETITMLLENILGQEKSDTAIVGGIQVLLALLDIYATFYSPGKLTSQSSYNSNINDEGNDMEQKQKILSNISRAIQPRLRDFHSILVDPPKQNPISTSLGVLDPPLGNVRLQVTKLITSLVSTGNDDICKEIMSCGTFSLLLDLFFKYQWNNFLHTQVEHCLIMALKCPISEGIDETNSNTVIKHILVSCKLIERLLDAWEENDEEQYQRKGIRKGYMGHVISMVNKIVDLCSNTSLGQFLKDTLPSVAERLEEFKKTTLSITNNVQDTLLGGVHPNNSTEENDEYIMPFLQSNMLQQQFQMFSQMHSLMPQYDNYGGFHDDAFADPDDLSRNMDRAGMPFNLSDGELAQQQELFKQVCAQNINAIDDADDQIFEDKGNSSGKTQDQQEQNETYSSDSDDETVPDDGMETDTWSSLKPTAAPPPIENTSDPWGSNFSAADEASSNWADFSSTKFEADFWTGFSQTTPSPKKEKVVESDLVVENVESTAEIDQTVPKEEKRPEAGDSGGKPEGETSSSDNGNNSEPSKKVEPEVEAAKSEETKQVAD